MMWKKGALLASFVCAAVAVGLLTGIAWRSSNSVVPRFHWWSRGPRLEVPRQLDLGQRERGQIATGEFELANAGSKELLIEGVRSGCACQPVLLERGGQYYEVDTIRLAPDEKAVLALRIPVRAPVGTGIRAEAYFRTNDPGAPEVTLVAVVSRVTGGVATWPTSLDLGTVPLGDQAKACVEVWDSANPPRPLKGVTVSNSALLRAKLLPPPKGGPKHRFGTNDAVIGRIEIELCASRPGTVREQVGILLSEPGHMPDVLPVFARVVGPVEAYPSEVYLPRASRSGPIYWAQCLVKAGRADIVRLVPCNMPSGVSLTIKPVQGNARAKLVRIEWKPDASAPIAGMAKGFVTLRAYFQDGSADLKIPICRRAGEIAQHSQAARRPSHAVR